MIRDLKVYKFATISVFNSDDYLDTIKNLLD